MLSSEVRSATGRSGNILITIAAVVLVNLCWWEGGLKTQASAFISPFVNGLNAADVVVLRSTPGIILVAAIY